MMVQPKLQCLLLDISKHIFPKPLLCMILDGAFSCISLKQVLCSEELPYIFSLNSFAV